MKTDHGITPLTALLALARIDVNDAATQLASSLDVLSQARTVEQQCQGHLQSLRDTHTRMSQPDMPLNVAAMSWLANQAQQGLQAQDEARAQTAQAEDATQQARQAWHAVQQRQDMLQRSLKEARQAHAQERERLASIEREDLFLSRRYVIQEAA